MESTSKKTAFLFPGQGSQAVGMGKDLCEAVPAASAIFDRAEQATSLPLRKICFEGPEEELSRTDIAQPAIFTVSAAMLAVMEEMLSQEQFQAISPTHVAGLSLGEYTALYVAGAMDFETGVKLVARRGALMQEAAEAVESGMVSLIGLDEDKARELCLAAAQGQVLTCANFNCPGQIVISGELDACKRAEAMATEHGARMAVALKVAGAFHSELMAPAAAKLAHALSEIEFKEPKLQVLANADADYISSAADIPNRLLAQLTSPVKWQQSIEKLLANGVEKYYEIGPGKVLTGLMRRIDRRADMTCVNSAEGVEKLAST